MGCMQKVFDVEIDLDLLEELEARREGFGAVKARRAPLPMCHAEVSSCYEHRGDEVGCRNPEFFEVPLASPSFRVFAQLAGLALAAARPAPRPAARRLPVVELAQQASSPRSPSGPAVSRIAGSPSKAGWARNVAIPSPIARPRASCGGRGSSRTRHPRR